MARLVLVALALSFSASGALAEAPNPPPSAWHVANEPMPPHSYDLMPIQMDERPAYDPEGRIVAGTEVLPNGTVGFGMFGERGKQSVHSRATVRDFTLPKARKPAVGFSLKF